MAEFEQEVEKTVTETKKYKQCDYCQLVTTEDISEDEEFSEILLNPDVRVDSSLKIMDGEYKNIVNEIKCADTERKAENILRAIATLQVEGHADLCPGCVNSLFGDGPATGIRSGTGMLEDDS